MQAAIYETEEQSTGIFLSNHRGSSFAKIPSRMAQTKFNLEDRLLEFSVRIINVADGIKRTAAGSHLADQLMRSGTSPYGHHGEAEGAEARADFVHKLRICHKELRETGRWFWLVQRVPLIARPEALADLLDESDQLVRIFAASIRTAEANREGRKPI
jgi:four helix bundle protein